MKTNQNQTSTVWQNTPHANLVRYIPSGTLFARIRVRGKLIRKSLKTSDLQLGKRKLLALEKQERGRAKDQRDGKLTFGDALKEFRANGYRSGASKRQAAPIKPRTRAYYEERITKVIKEWKGIEDRQVQTISGKECTQFAAKLQETMSASAYNHTVSILRHVLQIGVDSGSAYETRRDTSAVERNYRSGSGFPSPSSSISSSTRSRRSITAAARPSYPPTLSVFSPTVAFDWVR